MKTISAPHSPEHADLLDGNTLYAVTGVDARTGRIETYTNCKFYWSLDGKRQVWSCGGSSLSYALDEIHSYEEMK